MSPESEDTRVDRSAAGGPRRLGRFETVRILGRGGMGKDPANRYPTCGALAQELASALAEGTKRTDEDTPPPVPRSAGGPRVPAVTEYRRLAIFERYALVEARPLTGRLHQIRRHFKHIGHPLIGDVRYGKGEQNRLFRERFGLHRLALHAVSLSFDHPRTGERLRIVAPLLEDLAGVFEKMGIVQAATMPGHKYPG
jgi:hypothetical protein